MTRNLSDLLQKSLDAAQMDLIHRVADSASELGFPLYIVGGLVRDLLLGRDGADFDLVVEGDAIRLARALAKKYGGKVTAHEKFGTAKIDIREWKMGISNHSLASIDLISSRSETYKHPVALPTVSMGSIADDLRRRDFTINTLAIQLDDHHFGELRDDLGGEQDLENKIVRVLYPRSFVDDPTRIYRAARYEQRYGFKIAEETLALIPEARPLIEKLSAQRIRHELDLILEEPKAASMLKRLDELDLLKPIHATLLFDESTRRRFANSDHTPEFPIPGFSTSDLGWLLWLMTLSEKQIDSLNKRLHFTATLTSFLKDASKLFSSLSSYAGLKPSQCVERLDKIPPFSVYAVFLVAPEGKPKQALEKYLGQWRHIQPKTTGHDLKKLGLKPGPKYQKILWSLRAAWLDGHVSSFAQEQNLLNSLVHNK